MSLSVLSMPQLSMLRLPALRAFHPSPEHGTLYAPTLAESPQPDMAPSELITDGAVASDVDLFSLLLLGEVRDVATYLKEWQQDFPYQVPAEQDKGSPWFVESFKPGDDGAPGSATFYTPTPLRRVEVSQRSTSQTQFTYSIASDEGEFTQSIYIDTSSYQVFTDSYFARIRTKNYGNALRIALLSAQLCYYCGQYAAESELGALQFRVDNQGEWKDLLSSKRHFFPPDLDPEFDGELSFASQAAVFEAAHQDFRQAVVALELTPAEPPQWQLEIALYRPPGRSLGLMPLKPRLRHILWKPLFDRIFANPQ